MKALRTHFICLLSVMTLDCTVALAEQMGTFRFSEFSLSPRGRVEEPSQGGFELKESWIGFEWKRDESLNSLTGEISFGTADLISPAIWYAEKTGDLSLVQAAIKARTEYFDLRAGLLSIPNGYEGAFPEWEWSLPATRVRNHRWFTKRDFGVEIRTETKPFLSTVTVHNGESGTNLDQKLWATGLWRYLNPEGYGVLMTAHVGRTDSKSTATSTAVAEGFNFDPAEASKIRHGSLAFFRKWQRHLVLLEAGRGEILQKDQKESFTWAHFDISANLGGDLNLLLRYEQDQANTKNPDTVTKSTGFGFSASSEDRLSSITLWLNKNNEKPEQNNDEALLIFRLNSNYL